MKPHLQVAHVIRASLKEQGLKANVRTEKHPHGASVYVTLATQNDLATRQQLHKAFEMYCYGHSNAMTDSYDMDNVRDDIPQVRHIFIK